MNQRMRESKMSEIELKSCPCCGANADSQVLLDDVDNEINGYIGCSKCGLKIDFTIKPENVVFNFNDIINGINEVVDRWNRRDETAYQSRFNDNEDLRGKK